MNKEKFHENKFWKRLSGQCWTKYFEYEEAKLIHEAVTEKIHRMAEDDAVDGDSFSLMLLNGIRSELESLLPANGR